MDLNVKKPLLSARRAKRLYFGLFIAAAVVLVAYGGYVLVTRGEESTDDAQVAADIVPVAARIAGQVVAVHVVGDQPVAEGTLIAELDPREAEVRVSQAEGELETARAQSAEADAKLHIVEATSRGGLHAAQAAVESSREGAEAQSNQVTAARADVARARANAKKAAADWASAQDLGAKGDISRAQVDAARAANDAAESDVASAEARLDAAVNARQLAQANVRQAEGRLTQSAPVEAQVRAAQASANLAKAHIRTAEAALAEAKLALSFTKITAPAAGIASKLAVHPGSLVTVGQPIVQLVPRSTYVIANFKETQVKSMKPGQRATIGVDALDGKELEGRIQSLSSGTGASFSLLPPDNASGNFIKVVQRIPVRISWEGPPSDRLPAGSSVEVTVYTK